MCLLLQPQNKKINVQENPCERAPPLRSVPLAFIIKLFICKKIYKNYLIFLVKGVIIEKHLVSAAITMPRYGIRQRVLMRGDSPNIITDSPLRLRSALRRCKRSLAIYARISRS